MIISDITLYDAEASLNYTKTITTGLQGAAVSLQLCGDWPGRRMTAVFSSGDCTRDVLVTDPGCVPVPHECLSVAGQQLRLGLYGTDQAGTVTPTVYVDLGTVQQGADPSGDPGADPTPTVFQQMLAEAEQITGQCRREADRAEEAAAQAAPHKQAVASAVREHLRGAVAASDMVSPVPHRITCKVRSKNCLNFPENFPFSQQLPLEIDVDLRGTYVFTSSVSLAAEGSAALWGLRVNGKTQYIAGTAGSLAQPKVVSGHITQVRLLNYGKLSGTVRWAQLEEGSTPTPYTPYVTDFSPVQVRRLGGNLFHLQGAVLEGYWNGSGELSPNGQYKAMPEDIPCPGGGKLSVSRNGLHTDWFCAAYDREHRFIENYIIDDVTEKTVTLPKNAAFIRLSCRDDDYESLMVSYSAAPLPFVPYTEQNYTADSSGTVSGIESLSPAMTLMTGNPGVRLEADYNADTGKYIDRKFEQLQTAVYSNL